MTMPSMQAGLGTAEKAANMLDPMWTVTGSNGFLPLMRPLPSYSSILTGDGKAQTVSPASADEDTHSGSHAYVSALLALEAAVSSLPLHAARVSDPDSLAKHVEGMPILDVQGFLRAVEEAQGSHGHPLHDLSALPRAVLLYALFRDYSVLSAAYVYEPRGKALREIAPWEDVPGGAAQRPLQADDVKTRADALSKQSLPRSALPAALAIPLVALSGLTGLPPILEYTSYCLGCHGRADYDARPVLKDVLPGLPPSPPPGSVLSSLSESEQARLGRQAAGQPAQYTPQTWPWHALRLYRPMDGGTNEGAFILLHAEIEAHGGSLVTAIEGLLQEGLGVQLQVSGLLGEGAGKPAIGVLHPPNKHAVLAHLQSLASAMRSMIVSQLKMFNICDPAAYEVRTRPWIFGYKGNEDLPQGVLYEGVTPEQVAATGWAANIVPASSSSEREAKGVRLTLRGETGAQSTLIPTLDILTGITHKGDTLKDMLVELEQYRPVGHRQWLRALRRACWGDGAVAAGSAPGGLAGSQGYRAATGQVVCTAADEEAMDMEAPHAVRDYVRSTGDREAVRAFNALVQQVWAFRAVHVAYADLYIARVTAREGATGGTPYKAYLRKHRDESRAHQIWDGPAGAADCLLTLPYTLDPAAFTAEVEACLQPSTANCIPRHLLARHSADIREFGRDDPALLFKCW